MVEDHDYAVFIRILHRPGRVFRVQQNPHELPWMIAEIFQEWGRVWGGGKQKRSFWRWVQKSAITHNKFLIKRGQVSLPSSSERP